MSEYVINIAKDFSKEPFGRYPTDGESNGTKFREQFLRPALENHAKLTINFDGTEGYGSSFLDEAFGGLVFEHHMDPKELNDRLNLISLEDPSIADEVRGYINGN